MVGPTRTVGPLPTVHGSGHSCPAQHISLARPRSGPEYPDCRACSVWKDGPKALLSSVGPLKFRVRRAATELPGSPSPGVCNYSASRDGSRAVFVVAKIEHINEHNLLCRSNERKERMPIDLSDLLKPWVFRSDSAGNWDVYPYSVKAMTAIEKFFQSGEEDPAQGVRALIRIICKHRTDSEDGESSSELTEEEIENLSQEEIQRFSREFIEHNTNLLEREDDPPVKSEDQSDAAFLIDALRAEKKKQSEQLGEMFQGLKTRLGGILGTPNLGLRSVTQDLLKQNEGLEKIYGSSPSMFSPTPPSFEPIHIPENPTYKTNDHLSEMNDRLDRLIGFGEHALKIMNGLQVAAAEFLDKFSKEAEKNSKAAKRAIFVGALAVILSIGQIAYTEFRRVPQDSAAMSAALASLRGDIEQLKTVLSTDLANYQAAQEAASETIASALGAADATNTALLQSIDQLLRQQQERDRAIIEALEAIASFGPRPSE